MLKRVLSCILLSLSVASIAQAYDFPQFYSEEVVIVASRILQLQKDLPVSTTVVTKKEIEDRNLQNLGDILKYTYGTNSRTTGFLGSQISGSIRGSSYQQMLILIDGQKINSPLLGGYDLGDILLDNVEKVEIVRGPTSSLYGSDGMGGAINIVTQKGGKGIGIKQDLSEFGVSKTVVSLSDKISIVDYSLSIGQNTSRGYRPNGDYASLNYSGNLKWSPTDSLNMDFGFNLYSDKKGVPGSATYPSLTTRQEDDNKNLRLLTESQINSWSKLKFNISYNQNGQLFSADPTTIPFDKYNSYSYILGAQNELNLVNNNLLLYGIESENDRSESSLSGNHSVMNTGLFFEDQQTFNNFTFLLNDRIDNHSVYGSSTSPRAGILYKFNSDNSIKLSYGEAFRAPTLNDLFTYYLDPFWGSIMRGNPNLSPERSKDGELGFNLMLPTGTKLEANYFSSSIKNLIEWVDVSGTWMTWEAQNVDSADISGYEIGLSQEFAYGIKSFVNFTSQKPLNLTINKDLPYQPRTQFNGGIEWADKLDNSAGILLRYIGERYDDKFNTRLVDPYTVVDARLGRRINPFLLFNLGCENLFNTSYQETYGYPMPLRRYTFSVKYSLI